MLQGLKRRPNFTIPKNLLEKVQLGVSSPLDREIPKGRHLTDSTIKLNGGNLFCRVSVNAGKKAVSL